MFSIFGEGYCNHNTKHFRMGKNVIKTLYFDMKKSKQICNRNLSIPSSLMYLCLLFEKKYLLTSI